MKNIRFYSAIGLLWSFLIAVSPSVHAAVTVVSCVIQAPIVNSDMTSAYVRINYVIDAETRALNLPDPDYLVRVEIPALSDHIQIHRTNISDSGVASMEPIASLLVEEPALVLQPGGHHLMLGKLKKQPLPSEEYEMTLWFFYEPDAKCMAKVKPMDAILEAFKEQQ